MHSHKRIDDFKDDFMDDRHRPAWLRPTPYTFTLFGRAKGEMNAIIVLTFPLEQNPYLQSACLRCSWECIKYCADRIK